MKNEMSSLPPQPGKNVFFYKPQKTDVMWDTWIYHHDGTYYLYYLCGPLNGWHTIGLATSQNGVHWEEYGSILQAQDDDVLWVGSGAVWLRPKSSDGARFIMNFSEWRGGPVDGRQTIFFAESEDLIHWRRLSQKEFVQNDAWYEPKGRWDNVWAVASDNGGYYGYWAGTPLGRHGIGFGKTDDGISWQALEPPELTGVHASPEVGAVCHHNGRYYLLAGLDDLESVTARSPAGYFIPGITTLIGSKPEGPFVPAQKNRKLLIGNNSYFTRLLETPDGFLVNHHSWTINQSMPGGVEENGVWLAPLKRACWSAHDDALYLKWWEGNERAKKQPFSVNFAEALCANQRINFWDLKPGHSLHAIIEGKLELPVHEKNRLGLFIELNSAQGAVFWVLPDGVVEYGTLNIETAQFKREGLVDRDLLLSGSSEFRVILHGAMTEFYLDDYLMQCYSLESPGTGRIGVIDGTDFFTDVTAWYLAD